MKYVRAALIDRRALLKGAMAAPLIGAGLGLSAPALARRAAAMVTVGGARIDPSTVQLLIADLQPSLLVGSRTAPPDAIARSATVLAKVGEILALPTLFSIVPEGANPPSLISELRPFANQANTILRTLAGPFMDGPTTAALARAGRKTLVIAGYAAEVVVLQAVLDAIAAGYRVHYVVDAIGSMSARTEEAAFREMEGAGAMPTSVLSLTTRLTPDFFHAPGSETFAALQVLLRQ